MHPFSVVTAVLIKTNMKFKLSIFTKIRYGQNTGIEGFHTENCYEKYGYVYTSY